MLYRTDSIAQAGKTGTVTVEHHCTSSIGVVLFIRREMSAGDILKWAGMAMYQATSDGRNGVHFHQGVPGQIA